MKHLLLLGLAVTLIFGNSCSISPEMPTEEVRVLRIGALLAEHDSLQGGALFGRISSLTADESNIYATDSRLQRVVVLPRDPSEEGYFFGKEGRGPGELTSPARVRAISDGDKLLVSDGGSSTARVFGIDGMELERHRVPTESVAPIGDSTIVFPGGGIEAWATLVGSDTLTVNARGSAFPHLTETSQMLVSMRVILDVGIHDNLYFFDQSNGDLFSVPMGGSRATRSDIPLPEDFLSMVNRVRDRRLERVSHLRGAPLIPLIQDIHALQNGQVWLAVGLTEFLGLLVSPQPNGSYVYTAVVPGGTGGLPSSDCLLLSPSTIAVASGVSVGVYELEEDLRGDAVWLQH